MKKAATSKHLLVSIVLGAALALGVTFTVDASSTAIFSYDAGGNGVPAVAPNPTSDEGGDWIAITNNVDGVNIITEGLSPDPLDPDLNAWRTLDNLTTSGGVRFQKSPTGEQVTNAIWAGWKASAYWRIADPVPGNAGTIAVFFSFGSTNSIMDRRYAVLADIDANGALYASSTTTTAIITTNTTDALAYHLYEIVYDSATATAELRVDGQVVSSNWPALSASAATDGCQWGTGSTPGRGDAYFNQVKVEVNDASPTVVVLDPVSVSKKVGASATFTADFTGVGTNLQWYKDGIPIPGANQRSYTVYPVIRSSAGKYWMGIADPLTGDEVTTAPATLTVDAPKSGVTILVHGFVFAGATDPFSYWGGGANMAALLRRFQSGLVWLYHPDTGNYENITHSSTYPIPTTGWIPSYEGEQILLFDWVAASNDKESGQAEAAADALFASLMEFKVNGKPIISTSPYAALRPLHFIGHSRGTIVVSETVQRLGRFHIPVSYVTYLDPHDFGEPGILKDEFFHDPAVQVWDNVDYADCFYQTNPPDMCGQNPAGRPLAHFASNSPLQRDLTAVTSLSANECTSHDGRPHAWLKEYYWGTVATNGGTTPLRPVRWYGGGNGQGYGFDRWFSEGGYNHPRIPDSEIRRVKCTVASEAIPFVWQRNLANDREYYDRNDVPPVLFNGDFSLPDLDRGIGGTQANSMAGWYYFGGGGRAFVRPIIPPDPNTGVIPPGTPIPDSYLSLHDGALVATHNRFFLPTGAREIRFGMSVPYVPVNGTHTLQVSIGNRLLRAFTVAKTSGFEVRTVSLANDPDLLGGVNTLTFKLITVPGLVTGLTAKVYLNNISIVTDPTGWIDSISRNADGSMRIDWQCWPAGTFCLQSTTNLSGGDWQTVTNSPPAETTDHFNVPNSGQDQAFFRGLIVPAR